MQPLPPGQYETTQFPRFGLWRYAERIASPAADSVLQIAGDVERFVTIERELRELPRVEQTSDFHCVTTWTRRGLRWGGVRFADFYERIVRRQARPRGEAVWVIFRCADGYAASLPLEDLLAPDVLLADTLDRRPLSIAHGAPLRVVAPAHYGYKNAKHLTTVEFREWDRGRSKGLLRLGLHPRARVWREERGSGVPGAVLRYLYRPLVGPTVRRFRRADAARRPFRIFE